MSFSEAANYQEIAAASMDRSLPEITHIANHYASSVSYDTHVAALEHSIDAVASYFETFKRAVKKAIKSNKGVWSDDWSRSREAFENFEEGLSRGIKIFADTKAGLTESQSIPQQLRTHAFNVSAAYYEELLELQKNRLLGYSAFKDDFDWDPEYQQEVQDSLDLADQINASEDITSRGGQFGENTDATCVAIAMMSLLLVLWMPSLYSFVLRDPRQQPYKKKKKNRKPQKKKEQQEQQLSTKYKNTNKIKHKAPDRQKKVSTDKIQEENQENK